MPMSTLNRQLPNIAHVITSTISPHPHMPHFVNIALGVIVLPHIAKVTKFLSRDAMHSVDFAVER